MSRKPTDEDLEKRIEALEARLADSADAAVHLRRILDCSPSVIYTKDLAGRYTAINRQFEHLSGLKRENVIGKTDFDLFPSPVAQQSTQNDRSVLETGKPIEMEEVGPVRGEMHTFISTKYPLITEDGELYGICGISSDITDRKTAEKELAKIFSMSLDMICIADINTSTFLKVNPAFEETLGYTSEELLEKPFFDFIHPDDIDATLAVVEDKLRMGTKAINFENRYRCKDGRYRWLSWVSHPNPEMGVTYAVARDVTDWKEAEKTLERSKALLDATGRMARVGGWEVDVRTLDVSWTDETYRIHEVPFDYKPPLKEAIRFFHPDDRGRLSAAIQHAMNDGQPYDMEIRFITAKGTPLWTRTICEPELENGRVVKLRGMFQDITSRKNAEEALKKSHERFLKVLNCIDATIYVADMETYEILFMNRHMIESFGRDMTGDICWRAFRGENAPCAHCTNDRLLDGDGKPADVHVWQGKNPVTHRWYINYDRAIEWIDGRLVRLQIATDITDFKIMEEELRQAQKMEAIGTLSGGIAHEFNNMLGIILGNAELAMGDLPGWHPAAESISEIRTASMRAKEVVRKLLSVSRKAPSHKSPIRIRSIVEESLDLLRKTIPATIEIRKRFLCDTETILADSTEISQIMINLCTNAVHAMSDDTGVLDVCMESVSLDRDASASHPNLEPGDYVRLVVTDSGAGIAPDILERVFDPYFTTKEVNQGLGMGLAVVQGIVWKHDGVISIRSEPGKGTTVEVLFPLLDAPIPSEEQKQAPPRTGSGSILFVDDEPALVDLAKQMLTRAGYQVTGMISSQEALKMFKTDPRRFDLVMTDMAMPGMPGDRLARELLLIRPDVPIVLCTGHSDRIDEKKARETGIQGLMMKPFTYVELTQSVGEVLDSVQNSRPTPLTTR